MTKKLLRSKSDKMIAGVCGGLGEYFDFDSNIIRLIFVAFTLLWGSGVLAYILFWIIVPLEGGKSYFEDISGSEAGKEKVKGAAEKFAEEVKDIAKPRRKKDGNLVFAIILIFLGLIFLANNFIPFSHIFKLWPLILVIIGLSIIFSSAERG